MQVKDKIMKQDIKSSPFGVRLTGFIFFIDVDCEPSQRIPWSE